MRRRNRKRWWGEKIHPTIVYEIATALAEKLDVDYTFMLQRTEKNLSGKQEARGYDRLPLD